MCPVPVEKPSLWRFWEFVAVILGAIATLGLTDLLPVLYWPGVLMVWIGFGGMFFDGLGGRWHKKAPARIAISILGLVGFVWWTGWVVFAKVPVIVDAKLGGDGNIRIYLDNQSRYSLSGGDIEVSVDGLITDISQSSQVCQGFSYFPEDRPMFVTTNQGNLFPSGKSWANKGRVVCDKLPHTSISSLVVSVFSTDIGRDPKKPFPQNAHSDKLPKWCSVKGEYRALGRTREFHNKFEFGN